jgi:hypothetical protein
MIMEIKNKKLLVVLRRCLNSRFILKSKSRELFDSLVAQHDEVNSYFSQLGAEVLIDKNLGVARLRELPECADQDLPQLGRSVEFSPPETLALLFLRKRRIDYFSGDVTEEAPSVTKAELKEYLEPYKTSADLSKFQSLIDRVIKNLSYWQILVSKGSNRFEITPVCEIMLTADYIKTLKENAEKYFENLKKFGTQTEVEELADAN